MDEKERQEIEQRFREMANAHNQLVAVVQQLQNLVLLHEKNQDILNRYLHNMSYELKDLSGKCQDSFPVIRSGEEAIEEIIRKKKSLARFGDGEFAQMLGEERQTFQRLDAELGARLREVFHSKREDMLIAIANHYGSLERYTEDACNKIRAYMGEEGMREKHATLLEKGRVYYDAYVTRPYVIYVDQDTEAPKKRFDHLKEIWKNRQVIMIEGAQTRLGVGNDLFAGCSSIERIEAPATSSFDRYEEILEAALQYGRKGSLFLIALGPAAGVLAYDLSKAGYQALDIGHVDMEYEWFLAGKGERVVVPYKYNNELEADIEVEDCQDDNYRRQIIVDLSV